MQLVLLTALAITFAITALTVKQCFTGNAFRENGTGQ